MGTDIEFEGFEDAVVFLPLVASAVGVDNLVIVQFVIMGQRIIEMIILSLYKILNATVQ